MKIRNVNANDYSILRTLSCENKPLDLHTPYTYWVCCNYYSQYCFILEHNDTPVGYIMSITNKDCVFVWQIAVSENFRGHNLSRILIGAVVKKAVSDGYSELLVTIAPENKASYYYFYSYSKSKNFTFKKIGSLHVEDKQENILQTEHETIYKMELLEEI